MFDPDTQFVPVTAEQSEMEIVAHCCHAQSFDEARECGLRPDHFAAEFHRRIFAAAVRLRDRGDEHLDAVMVADEADFDDEEIDRLGGILNATFANGSIEYHARRIIDAYRSREIQYACIEGLRAIRDDRKPEDVVAIIGPKLDAALDADVNGPESVSDVLMKLERLKSHPEERAIETGFPMLDSLLGGFRSGNLVVLAARPGLGKSALALKMVLHAVRELGESALFVSLEMPSTELIERLLSLQSGLPHKLVQGDSLDEIDAGRLTEAQNELTDTKLRVFDRTGLRVSDIAAAARLYKRREGLRLLVLDYIQLIDPTDRKVIREQQIAEISRSLKQLAKSVGSTVLCLAQLNRSLESRTDKRPRLADLRESGSIEQDADSVLLIHQPNESEPQRELIVAKNRHGQTGSVPLDWIGSRMEFREAEQEDIL